MKFDPLITYRKLKNKGELRKEVKRKYKRKWNRLVNREWKKQWCWLEREMCPGTLYPPILEKNTNDGGTEKKTNTHLDQEASGRLIVPNNH